MSAKTKMIHEVGHTASQEDIDAANAWVENTKAHLQEVDPLTGFINDLTEIETALASATATIEAGTDTSAIEVMAKKYRDEQQQFATSGTAISSSEAVQAARAAYKEKLCQEGIGQTATAEVVELFAA